MGNIINTPPPPPPYSYTVVVVVVVVAPARITSCGEFALFFSIFIFFIQFSSTKRRRQRIIIRIYTCTCKRIPAERVYSLQPPALSLSPAVHRVHMYNIITTAIRPTRCGVRTAAYCCVYYIVFAFGKE